MKILVENIEGGITYREIYNRLREETSNFTVDEGVFKCDSLFESNLAKEILGKVYSNVYTKPLDMNDDYDLFYSVVFSNKVSEGYKDLEIQPDKNPAGTPIGNGTGLSEQLIEKIVKKSDGYYVQSERGKNLGGPYSKEDAEKRLKQVEYFKHKNESLNEAKFSNATANDDVRLVRDSYDHFTNDLGELPSPDDIFYDIIDNYDQDIFKDGDPFLEGRELEAIKYILRSQGLEYRGDFDESLNEAKEIDANKFEKIRDAFGMDHWKRTSDGNYVIFYNDNGIVVDFIPKAKFGAPFKVLFDYVNAQSDSLAFENKLTKKFGKEIPNPNYRDTDESLNEAVSPFVEDDIVNKINGYEMKHLPSWANFAEVEFSWRTDKIGGKSPEDMCDLISATILYFGKDDERYVYGKNYKVFDNGKVEEVSHHPSLDKHNELYKEKSEQADELLNEAKNKNYRVELYYYDNNKPDDVVYFENLKVAYNFCNNKISDNIAYDDGLTGILVFNEAKDKLLNTWQNGSRGWANKSKELTKMDESLNEDKKRPYDNVEVEISRDDNNKLVVIARGPAGTFKDYRLGAALDKYGAGWPHYTFDLTNLKRKAAGLEPRKRKLDSADRDLPTDESLNEAKYGAYDNTPEDVLMTDLGIGPKKRFRVRYYSRGSSKISSIVVEANTKENAYKEALRLGISEFAIKSINEIKPKAQAANDESLNEEVNLKPGDVKWSWWLHRYLIYKGFDKFSNKYEFEDFGDDLIDLTAEEVSKLEDKPNKNKSLKEEYEAGVKIPKKYLLANGYTEEEIDDLPNTLYSRYTVDVKIAPNDIIITDNHHGYNVSYFMHYSDLARFAREINESLNEGVSPEQAAQLNKECDEIYKYLSENGIHEDIWWDDSGRINIEIEWGDWKHEHLRCNRLMTMLGYECVDEVVTDEDGSDTYSARYIYKKIMDESLNESDKPSFLDYMYDIFGDDDRWEENPDVEEYYRNEYERGLDDLDDYPEPEDRSNLLWPEDHSEPKEEEPEEYEMTEEDYSNMLDSYNLTLEMSDEEAKTQIEKEFAGMLSWGGISKEDYIEGQKEIFDTWKMLKERDQKPVPTTEALNEEDEEPEARCPNCGEEMDFIGYQGYDEEFKCPICDVYFYYNPNKEKLMTAVEYEDMHH